MNDTTPTTEYLSRAEFYAEAAACHVTLKANTTGFPQPIRIGAELYYFKDAATAYLKIVISRAITGQIGMLLSAYNYCELALKGMNTLTASDERLSLRIVEDPKRAAIIDHYLKHSKSTTFQSAELRHIARELQKRAEHLKVNNFKVVPGWVEGQAEEHIDLIGVILEEVKKFAASYKRLRPNNEFTRALAAKDVARSFTELMERGSKAHRREVLEIEKARAEAYSELRGQRDEVIAMIGNIKAGLNRIMQAEPDNLLKAEIGYSLTALEHPPRPAIIRLQEKPLATTFPECNLPWDDPDFDDDDTEIEYFCEIDEGDY